MQAQQDLAKAYLIKTDGLKRTPAEGEPIISTGNTAVAVGDTQQAAHCILIRILLAQEIRVHM